MSPTKCLPACLALTFASFAAQAADGPPPPSVAQPSGINLGHQDALGTSQQVGAFLQRISEGIQGINEMNQHIALAAREQSLVAEAVNGNILAIHQLSDGVSRHVDDLAQSARQLNGQSELLRHQVGPFRV